MDQELMYRTQFQSPPGISWMFIMARPQGRFQSNGDKTLSCFRRRKLGTRSHEIRLPVFRDRFYLNTVLLTYNLFHVYRNLNEDIIQNLPSN